MVLPTTMGMDYESIQELNNVRPYEFETDRERKWYEIGLIDGAEAADINNVNKWKKILAEMWNECAGGCSAQLSIKRCKIETVAEKLGIKLEINNNTNNG